MAASRPISTSPPSLKPELERIDGFLSIERFQSLVDDKKLLSLSFWRDEEAVKAWRNVEHHRQAQAAGTRRRAARLPPARRRRACATTA